MVNGKATQFSEHWMREFGKFTERYPDLKDDWRTSLEAVIKVQTEKGIPFIAVYNPWREKRIGKQISIPSYYESILAFKKGGENTVIFGEDYSPFFILINIFPIVHDHVAIVHEEPSYGPKKEMSEGDLEIMVRMQEGTGISIWHNMKGAGVTIEDWDHFQGALWKPAMRSATKACYDSVSHVYFMPDYPGQHVVLNGDRKVGKAIDTVKFLNDKGKSYNVSVDDGFVYVIPIKDDRVGVSLGLSEKSRIGGFETFGSYVALTWDDFSKFLRGEVKVGEVLRRALYSWDDPELNLKNRFN